MRRRLLRTALISGGAAFFLTAAENVLLSLGVFAGGQELLAEAAAQLAAGGIIGLLIETLVIAPLAEEFIFRKILFGMLRKYTSFAAAAAVSALLFAHWHGTAVQALYAFPMGCLFAYFYETAERAETYATVVCAHAAANAAGVLWMILAALH